MAAVCACKPTIKIVIMSPFVLNTYHFVWIWTIGVTDDLIIRSEPAKKQGDLEHFCPEKAVFPENI